MKQSTMRAMVITRSGGPEVLALREVPLPNPAAGDVRVRIRATALNRADLLQRMGLYPVPHDAPADIPGLEFAGEVEAIGDGEGTSDWRLGDRVFGLASGGTYAEFVTVPARTLARIPSGLSFEQAAAIPEAFITAYDAMVTQAGLVSGERVLINAVGSGVGTAAVQIARALGARTVGTARSADKLHRAAPLGLDDGVLVTGGRFANQVLERAGPTGVNVILELVGGDYLAEDLVCAAVRARIVLVGLLGGAHAQLDLRLLLGKRLNISGTMLRTRPLEEKISATQDFVRGVVPLLADGTLHPVIDRTFALSEAAAAHAYLAANGAFGKVVLTGLP